MTPANVKKAVARMVLAARECMAQAGETTAKVTVRRHKIDHGMWLLRVTWPDMAYQRVVTDMQLMYLRDAAVEGKALATIAIHGAAKLRADKEAAANAPKRDVSQGSLKCQ